MSIKPKAKKFRIRRGIQQPRPLPPQLTQQATGTDDDYLAAPDDGFGDTVFPTAAKAAQPASNDGQAATEGEGSNIVAEIAAIRAEGLTGRQLRMARRIALKHGINASSDYEAVRLLRQRGIDPFQQANMLEVVGGKQSGGNLPAPHKEAPVPSAQVTEGERAAEILRIQRNIAARRKKKLFLMTLRLAFFVALPTAIASYYYYKVATPMYATHTQFVIQQADGASGGQLGGLFAGTGFASSQDSISVQTYLQSRDAMTRLDEDKGFKRHFQNTAIDPIQRLEPDATNEDAYKIYKKNVRIAYDPSEGVVQMEVVAVSPETSVEFSRSLIDYAEEQVDHLTQRLREDQMAGARESYREAERNMLAAQQRVVALQENRGVFSAESESSLIMSQISGFETERNSEQLRLDQLLANENPNAARVQVLQNRIKRLDEQILAKRSQLTESTEGTTSLANITGELLVAQADLETRQLLLQSSLQQLETARIEANRQVRYLSIVANPILPDAAAYPRAFENTLLALFIFSGIYLMASLTASILREQVAS